MSSPRPEDYLEALEEARADLAAIYDPTPAPVVELEAPAPAPPPPPAGPPARYFSEEEKARGLAGVAELRARLEEARRRREAGSDG